MNDLDTTLAAMEKGWRCVLLQPRSKHPALSRDRHHRIATGPDEVHDWITKKKGNVGIYAGTHIVLDFDDITVMNAMFLKLRFLEPTVITGSGKRHCYVEFTPDLIANMGWDGKVEGVGQILRLPTQYVVAPPSIHPNGQPYVWQTDTPWDLTTLPEKWLDYLRGGNGQTISVPEEFRRYVGKGMPVEEPWFGPPADELIRRALLQPGARLYHGGAKFQCPGCRDIRGRDRHQDNAWIRPNGRWGCAWAKDRGEEIVAEHRRAIGKALGVFAAPLRSPLRLPLGARP